MSRQVTRTLDSVLERLRAETILAGDAPAEVADYAVAVTRSALANARTAGVSRRAEAYYRAVVRRRLVRVCAGTPHAARLVVESVVDDLIASGRSARDAWDEVSRGWSHLLTPELSREFHDRLCA